MLSSSFWYGFMLGLGLVFLIFAIVKLISRARAKKSSDS
jgi:hypothetical protein